MSIFGHFIFFSWFTRQPPQQHNTVATLWRFSLLGPHKGNQGYGCGDNNKVNNLGTSLMDSLRYSLISLISCCQSRNDRDLLRDSYWICSQPRLAIFYFVTNTAYLEQSRGALADKDGVGSIQGSECTVGGTSLLIRPISDRYVVRLARWFSGDGESLIPAGQTFPKWLLHYCTGSPYFKYCDFFVIYFLLIVYKRYRNF